MTRKKRKLKARVEKVIKPAIPSVPEKAQIEIHDADHLYREIRIENTVTDGHGQSAALKEGAEVDVIVEADADATKPVSEEKPTSRSKN